MIKALEDLIKSLKKSSKNKSYRSNKARMKISKGLTLFKQTYEQTNDFFGMDLLKKSIGKQITLLFVFYFSLISWK